MDTNIVDPSFDITAHNIIALDDILNSESSALELLRNDFKSKGWSIVRLPSPKAKLVNKPFITTLPNIKSVETFFLSDKDQKSKCKGYTSRHHKESIHVVTNPETYLEMRNGNTFTQKLVAYWAEIWDVTVFDLLKVLAPEIFKCTVEELIANADLSTFHYGMLDVAFYKNEQTTTLSPQVGHSTEDVNCVPHYDPGLLSVSFLSSHEGLQLQDPKTQEWFAGPVNTREGEEDLGVIWLGDAAVTASKKEFQPGVHRVVYPQTREPRIAAWYEVCTNSQLVQETNMFQIPAGTNLKLPNLPNSKSIYLEEGADLPIKIEEIYGVPMSKTLYDANYTYGRKPKPFFRKPFRYPMFICPSKCDIL